MLKSKQKSQKSGQSCINAEEARNDSVSLFPDVLLMDDKRGRLDFAFERIRRNEQIFVVLSPTVSMQFQSFWRVGKRT